MTGIKRSLIVAFTLFICLCFSVLKSADALRCVARSRVVSSTALYYDFLSKKDPTGEKKDPVRLIKNIMFPGIYREYADTKEVRATIKVQTKQAPIKSRNEGDSFQSQSMKEGTYNMADPVRASSADFVVRGDGANKPLKPLKAAPEFLKKNKPSAAITLPAGGLSVLADVKAVSPSKPLILYEYEDSPDCKKVREACAVLDLPIEVRPCPGSTSGFSDQLSTITLGKREVPCMIDNNPSMYRPTLFGTKEIIPYLFKTYTKSGEIPGNFKGGLSAGKSGGGKKIRANARPDFLKIKPITLYGWEGAPFYKPVRETLNNLGLSHIIINCANGSKRRSAVTSKSGGPFSVPFIVDPNTGVELFESKEIVRYLEATYTV